MGQALADLETEGGNPIGIAVLRMTMLTGARPGEIEGLTWAEVDMENQCLRLAQSKTGYSARPLSQAAVRSLEEFPRQQTSEEERVGTGCGITCRAWRRR